jgi:hypothetical protein
VLNLTRARARIKGLAVGPEWLKQIPKFKVDDADPWALPPILELSVEDARRKWFGDRDRTAQ